MQPGVWFAGWERFPREHKLLEWGDLSLSGVLDSRGHGAEVAGLGFAEPQGCPRVGIPERGREKPQLRGKRWPRSALLGQSASAVSERGIPVSCMGTRAQLLLEDGGGPVVVQEYWCAAMEGGAGNDGEGAVRETSCRELHSGPGGARDRPTGGRGRLAR